MLHKESLEDFAAMKLNAISNSGKRLKDFINVYYLLEHFSMDEMITFYTTKYPNFNPLIALRSVNCFDDIDPAIDPPKLKEKLPLSEIKNELMMQCCIRRSVSVSASFIRQQHIS
jgi:hypothetical protein